MLYGIPDTFIIDTETVYEGLVARFWDMGFKAAYDFKLYSSFSLQINAGAQNIFNSFQNDFDSGADRDSGYIYGPTLPRTFFLGVKLVY